MKFLIKILLLFLIFNSVNIYAQRSKTADNLTDTEKENMAEEALQEENYEKAVLLYKKLLDKKPDNSRLNFLVGFCYLNTNYGIDQSIEHFEKAIAYLKKNDTNNAPLETYYYLAKAYYNNNNFNKAIGILDNVIAKIPKNESQYILRIQTLRKKCENGNNISQNKLEIKVENLFELNSKYSDHSPLVNQDETDIIFTSRRAGTKIRVKSADKQFDANIYTSLNIDSAWQAPYSIINSVNSSSHEAATFISANRKTMIIHKYDRNKGSLYISRLKENGEWGKLVHLGSNVNTKHRETTGSISPDGRKLYFMSDRKGGYGGLDIYVSDKLKNGSWGTAKNLGATVNSSMDEETPFIHKNGTLFFCSKGHGSMGGFDIFASSKIDKNTWSNPVNLGVPINSVEDDFCYIPDIKGKFAYYASKRQGGKGNSDIYRVALNKQIKNYAVVSGKIMLADKNEEVKIQITDLNGNNQKIFKLQIKNNRVDIILLTGKSYMLNIQVKDITVHKIKLNLGKVGSFISIEQHVILNDINLKSLTNSNIVTEEYTSKPKSTDITEDNFLADNNPSSTSGNNLNDKKGKLFSIQLAKSETQLNETYFNDLQDVKSHKEKSGSYIYYFGEYIYEWEAMIKLRMIKDKYPEAQIFVNNFNKEEFN